MCEAYGMKVKHLVASAARYTGTLDAYAFLRRKITKSQVVILLYHRVSPAEDMYLPPLDPVSFREQIKYVADNFEILGLDQLAAMIRSGRSLPEKAAVITIDDGYRDSYEYAYPILQEYEAPATVFVVTGNLDNGELFWWDRVDYILKHTTKGKLNLEGLGNYRLEAADNRFSAIDNVNGKLKRIPDDQKNLIITKLSSVCDVKIPRQVAEEVLLSWENVREMSKGGIVFGAHSVNHPILTNMPVDLARDEIVVSKRNLEKRLGKRVTSFSYPDGDLNVRIAKLVARNGFTCAVSVGPSKLVNVSDDVYRLSRICPGEDYGKFKALISGLTEDAARAWNAFTGK
jgi:peptidoglycan/xylan/chitin deacetylase (PgdA/CDA1 family)